MLLRILLFLSIIAICTQCRPDVTAEQLEAATRLQVDTATVTSFKIDRQDSPALANWAVFESGRETICVPPGWTAHLVARGDGQDLVLLPPDSSDSTERITFIRFAKDSPSVDYSAFARQLVTSAFSNFRLVEGGTVNKLLFQHDFAIERNTDLLAHGSAYKGYCLTYVNDRFVYQFRIVLAKGRLKAYQGDLFRDILGNLQIDKKYFIENSNPIIQIVHLH